MNNVIDKRLVAPPILSFKIFLKSRELILSVLLIAVFIGGSFSSPYFLDIYTLFDATAIFSEIALIALSMSLIIIARDIDLSVASTLALSSLMMGLVHQYFQAPMLVMIFVALLTGSICGIFNGFLITKLKLPSIIVTIGTMSLFRGLASGILGNSKISNYPQNFMNISQSYFLDLVPYSFIVFLLFSILFVVALHYTILGKHIMAIGNNPEASKFSGINPDKIRFYLFLLNGLMAGVASIFLTSRLGSTRPDIATGLELESITIVVLGGVSILGGKGTITGVFIAALVIGFLRLAITLNNVPGNVLMVFTGILLIGSVSLPLLASKYWKQRKT